jgi:hypothetical protein
VFVDDDDDNGWPSFPPSVLLPLDSWNEELDKEGVVAVFVVAGIIFTSFFVIVGSSCLGEG